MKWNADLAIAKLEKLHPPGGVPGTIISRVLMSPKDMPMYGVRPSDEQLEKGSALLWSIGFGGLIEAKQFFYGQSIYEAYLKARRVLKSLAPKKRPRRKMKKPFKKKRDT